MGVNQLTDTLGIDLPVLQSGMGGVATQPVNAQLKHDASQDHAAPCGGLNVSLR